MPHRAHSGDCGTIRFTQLHSHLHCKFTMVPHKMNQISALDEASPRRLYRFCPRFVGLARQRPSQAEYFPWIGKSQNEGFSFR